MDIEFIIRYIPMYAEAALLTLRIGIIGIAIAMIIGLVSSIILYYRTPVVCPAVSCYIELSRNTPLLVQLFFLYFGLPKAGIMISSEGCAIIGLSFLGGSYMAEVFRSGLDSVAAIQQESGLSLGMSPMQVMVHIIFPQALSTSVPALCANAIFLIKETSVFSAVALADLMFVTKDLIGMYYKTNEALMMLVIAYTIILLPLSLGASLLERRLRYAGFGY